ncbi:MAG: GNAT family N-acetyltransferase [Pseudomonadota bacterium]
MSWQQACRRYDFDELTSQLDSIFFEASATQTFDDGAVRAAFRDRWLGRYLDQRPTFASVALVERGRAPVVAGYVIGSMRDPSCDPLFSDIPYFERLADLCALYPAHLHINLAPAFRGRGIGQRLVRRFSAQAYVKGAGGLHVVTGARSRNVTFYRRLGLKPVCVEALDGNEIAMLAAKLPLHATR